MSTDVDIMVRDLRKSFTLREGRARSLREIFTLRHRLQRQQLAVIDGLSLTVRRGEWLGVVGQNASGKTTLLKLLAGILRPDTGTIAVHRPLAPVLQLGVGFHPDLTAEHNVQLSARLLGMGSREVRAQLPEILTFADVARFRAVPLRHYSLGMHLRLAFATAVRAPADILLLDEIFAVGDLPFWEKCHEAFAEMKAQGKTVLMVSHTPCFLERWCDRAILLEQGNVHTEGPPAVVLAEYRQRNTSEEKGHPLHCPPWLHGIRASSSSERVPPGSVPRTDVRNLATTTT